MFRPHIDVMDLEPYARDQKIHSINFNRFFFLRRSGLAKMIDNGKGVLWIRGKFKDSLPNPYFRVSVKFPDLFQN